MRSHDVTANGLADVVGLPHCPLSATRTLRMIENLIRVLMWFITDDTLLLSSLRFYLLIVCGMQ